MKYQPGFLDAFISSTTGKLRSISQLPSLIDKDYIIIGDYQGNAIISPALIDVRLDVLELRALLQKLSNLKFILQSGNFIVPNAQALDQLSNGFLYNNDNGVLSIMVPGGGTLALPHNQVFLGDSDNLAQPSPTILMDNLPDVPFQNLLIANSSNRLISQKRIGLENLPPFLSADPTSNYGVYNLYTGGINLDPSEPIAPSTTLRIDKSNLPNLSRGKIRMGVINTIPPVISIGVDGVTISGNLNWDARGALPIIGKSYGVPEETGLDPGTIFIGDFENPGEITQTGLPFGRMFIGNGFGQITNTGLLPYQLFSGNPDGSGQIIPITILDRTNLPILPFNNVWIGDGLDQAFPIPIGASLLTTPELTIAPTGVVAGDYSYPTLTVNAQGQILTIVSNIPTEGTVTEITLGTGLTGIPNPITSTGIISISPTGVTAGSYNYASILVNSEGQLLLAIDNLSNIEDMQDNIANNTENISTNTTNIANNTSAISTINTTLFDPVTGIVTLVGILNVAVFAPVTGVLAIIGNWTNSSSITDVVNNNTSDIAGIIGGTIPISTNFTGVGDVSGSGPLSSPITLTLNTTLDQVPLAANDVNVNNHKIINVSDATNPKDAVNLETLESYVGGLAVELAGFVEGGPAVGGILTTTRGPDCTLDVIPAAADVSFDNFSLTDLETIDFSSWSDMESKVQNGINFLFLWKFFGGGVS